MWLLFSFHNHGCPYPFSLPSNISLVRVQCLWSSFPPQLLNDNSALFIGNSPHRFLQHNRPAGLICQFPAPTSEREGPLEETQERDVFPLRTLVPQELLERAPMAVPMLISCGAHWVLYTSVAVWSGSLGSPSKASLKMCSAKHRFLLLITRMY